ncbi:hypothetical protein MBLNU457_4349t1 [Dothideomycetes sp. NU457]
MPPALVPSDDEEELDPDVEVDDVDDDVSDDLDTIPAKKPKPVKAARSAKPTKPATPEPEEEDEDEEEEAGDVAMDDKDEVEQEAGDEDDDEEEEGEGIYVVEKILDHQPAESGKQLYKVQWVGYTAESDMTWETEDNLSEEGAANILKAYWKRIGGKPKDLPATTATKGRKRKATSSATSSPAPVKKGRPAKTTKTESKENGTKTSLPPPDTWEAQVIEIITIEESTTKPTHLTVYCGFLDGTKKSIHMKTVRQNCPQKLLDYYEQHLTFKEIAQEVVPEVKQEVKHESKQ